MTEEGIVYPDVLHLPPPPDGQARPSADGRSWAPLLPAIGLVLVPVLDEDEAVDPDHIGDSLFSTPSTPRGSNIRECRRSESTAPR